MVSDTPEGNRTWAVTVPAAAEEVRLEFGALAEGCAVHCDGAVLAEALPSDFARPVVVLPDTGGDRLVEVVRPAPTPTARLPRGRWRTTLTADQSVRWRRVSMVGRAPFLGDLPAPEGPYRPVAVLPAERPGLVELGVDTSVPEGGVGRLRLRALLDRACAEVRVECAGSVVATSSGRALEVDTAVPGVTPWWPRGLGDGELYPLRIVSDGHAVLDTRVGFRTLEVDLAADADEAGVAFRVNGVPLHARGAVWSPVDPTWRRCDPDAVRAAVRRAARGGAVLLRVPGITVYPESGFWEACAEEGLLVWQDLMTANVDPPAEESVARLVRDELRDLLRDAAGSPSVAVISGGSEVLQQAEMSGVALDSTASDLLDRIVPDELERLRPKTAYVPSTPWTPPRHGAHIRVGVGVAHYFGVGGYRRPLADVRTADVRFAAECLAFSVPPVPWRVREFFGAERVAGHDPGWKAGVPRDRGAPWDFEDVRDHYARELYEHDPRDVRLTDPERALALGAAAAARATEEVLGWWRSPRSRCGGALVLSARDLVPGAGWGMVDVGGVPKSTWYAATHRWAGRALWVDDRGLDGLWVELHTDLPPGPGKLDVTAFGAAGESLHSGTVATEGVGPWSVDSVVGTAHDPGYALRFGPPRVACLDLTWAPVDGGDPVHHVWMPLPSHVPPARVDGFEAALTEVDGRWELILSTAVPVRDVVVDAEGYIPSDSWFALSPDRSVTVRLEPVVPDARPPRPTVTGCDGSAARLLR